MAFLGVLKKCYEVVVLIARQKLRQEGLIQESTVLIDLDVFGVFVLYAAATSNRLSRKRYLVFHSLY